MPGRKTVFKIAARFGLRPQEMEEIKSGVYRLKSPSGTVYCLKRMAYPTDQIRWIDSTLLAIKRKGFASICWRDPNRSKGKVAFVRPGGKGPKYILTPWISGNKPRVTSKTDLYQCGKRLAQFHRFSRFAGRKSKGAPYYIGRWPEMLRSKRDIMEKTVERAKAKQDPSKWEELMLTYGSEWSKRAKSALEQLNKSSYRGLCQKARKTGALCHGDSGYKNFVLTKQGPVIIDFETLRVDLPVYDLFRFVRSIGKNSSWNFSLTRSILDGYRSVTPLKPADYELLAVWLQFPYKPCNLISRYRQTRSSSVRRKIEKQLEEAAKDEQRIPSFLQHLADYAKEVD
ncbi:CotS family spore coat protein [Brevibacillus sp. B_LB10_24]|uniref:CotS family spore coat protein n=1 Tax=Brevibacillus sp. B_LB10_24 TaxID=3380645 RepID=UPI0038B739E3